MRLTPRILAGALACSFIFAGCASNKVPAGGKTPAATTDTTTTTVTTDIPTETEENQDAQKDKEAVGNNGSDKAAEVEKESETDSESTETSSSGLTKKSTLKAACDEAKFPMTAPDSIGDYKIKEYMAAEGQAVELVYESNTTGQTIAIKKSLGNLEKVGTESEYEVNRFVNDAGNRIFLRGDSINKIYIGTWNSGDYSFSIECPGGLSRESVLLLVREVN